MHPADHPVVTERYFFPRRGRPPADSEVRVHTNSCELSCARVDGGHERTLLHFHGNGEIVADYFPWFPPALDAMALNSFFAEYRGYGGSTDTPKLAAMLDDCDALVEAAGGPAGLIVFGRSIGSIYAIETAARYPTIAGLVIESGIANVLERILLRASPSELGATSEELAARFASSFDHEKKLRGLTCPVLVLHTEHDHLVSIEHARTNAAACGERARLVTFPRGDHNTILPANKDEYLRELTEFIRRLSE